MIDCLNQWQKAIRMRIGYPLFGNSIANFLNNPYFKYLEDKIPPEFLEREISDLGCGDGVATMKIKSIFKAKNVMGYEVNKSLADKARKRGMRVEILDLEKNVPQGDMAVVWGVLHHLNDKENILKKIRQNFKYMVLREPIKSWWAFLDGGEPLTEPEWKSLFSKTLNNYVFLRFKDSLFVFWKR